MKEKIKNFFKKAKSITIKILKKINKKAAVALGAVIVLAGAVVLNFLLVPEDIEKKNGKLDVAIDLSDVSAALADKEKEPESVSKDESEDMFAQMTMSRSKARDEAVEVLSDVAQSSTAIESMKKEALAELEQIAVDIECEANIESLIMAKGFDECVAVVNGDTASVIVRTDGLLANEVAQISEIVYEQAGVHPDNLNIIESK